MLIGRTQELKLLESAWEEEGLSPLVLYGGRRVGKTALVREFLAGRRAVFFTALESSLVQNLHNLHHAMVLSGLFTEEETGDLTDFDRTLAALFHKACGEQILADNPGRAGRTGERRGNNPGNGRGFGVAGKVVAQQGGVAVRIPLALFIERNIGVSLKEAADVPVRVAVADKVQAPGRKGYGHDLDVVTEGAAQKRQEKARRRARDGQEGSKKWSVLIPCDKEHR